MQYTMCASAIVVEFLPILALCFGAAVAEETESKIFGPWKNGIVYYNVDLYTTQRNLLTHLVKLGLTFIEKRSCLTFRYRDTLTMQGNFTFLNFAFTGVYEDCCEQHYEHTFYGKRMVVLSPRCNESHEVAHAILHAMGLDHKPGTPFLYKDMAKILFPVRCKDIRKKIQKFTISVAKQGRNYPDITFAR